MYIIHAVVLFITLVALNVREELVDVFVCSLCLEYYTCSGSVITVF